MAVNHLSANINLFGDAGNFETDPSTWGFGSDAAITYRRSATYKTKGSNSCEAEIITGGTGDYALSKGKVNVITGKKYIVYVRVRTTSANPIAADAAIIDIITQTGSKLTRTENNSTTVGAVKAGFVQISAKFDCIADGAAFVEARISTNANASSFAYSDEFEIYEYEEAAPDPCTVKVDTANVAVVSETGFNTNDGSITGAATGGGGTFEYRLYRRDTSVWTAWQSSALFSGLGADIYRLQVRDQADTTCQSAEVWFALNYTGTPISATAETDGESTTGSADGQIVITPAGGSAPYDYAINDLPEQNSNTISGVSAGRHGIVITDNSAGPAAYYFIVDVALLNAKFSKSYFSRSPVKFQLDQTANNVQDNYKRYIDIKVEDVPGSGSFQSKMILAQPPDANGKVVFNLSAAFRDVFTPEPPIGSSSSAVKVTGHSRLATVHFGDLWDDKTVPDTISASDPIQVVMGGIGKSIFPDEDYFLNHLPTYKRFLTWAPAEKQIDRTQNDWLYFYVYDEDITSLRVRGIANYTDNTQSAESYFDVSSFAVSKGDIVRFNAGPANSGVGALNPAKSIRYYTLWLVDGAGAVVSEKRRFNVEQYKTPDTRYVLFQNSVGGFDLLRLTGRASIVAEAERSISERYLPVDYKAAEGQMQSKTSSITRRTSYSSGFLSGKYGKYMMDYFQELLLSPAVYDVTKNKLTPIVIDKGTIQQTEGNYKYFIRFEALDSYNNVVFTPDVYPDLLP